MEYLNVRPGGVVVDATLGSGRGTRPGLRGGWVGQGRLICFDRDPEAMALGRARLAELADELGA